MRVVDALLGILIGLATAGLDVGVARALEPRLDSGGFRDEDREIAEEIASFSAEERHAALVAAGHPEDLLEVQQIQTESADAFADLVDGFSRSDQEQIWDLVRYPGLVADLARGGPKSDAELDRIAARHPEAIRDAIRREGRERYAIWVEIYALDLEAEQEFSRVIARHPAEVRAAFQRLRGRPDLLSLLVENVGVATRIGAAYREDPTRVEARFDSLHQEVLTARREQEKSWAAELEDPEARRELETAAREFAEDQGYDLDEGDPTVVQTRVVHVDHYVNANPYPYWFGYPTWYAYPYWYPASVWSHVGFRFGSGIGFASVGLPSPYFLGWYNDFYYGPRFGYGGYWGRPYGYFGGARPYRHFHSARYYDAHRRQVFHGHRRRNVDDGRDGRTHYGNAHRREAQDRLMRGSVRETDTRIGDRASTGRDSSGRRERFDRRGGEERWQSRGRSAEVGRRGGGPEVAPGTEGAPGAAEPRNRFQRREGDLRERQWTAKPGESRIERRPGTSRERGTAAPPRAPGVTDDRGRRRDVPPDVSSGPPSRFARADRFGATPRNERFERPRSSDRGVSIARERARTPAIEGSRRGSPTFSSNASRFSSSAGQARERLSRASAERSAPRMVRSGGGTAERALGVPRSGGGNVQKSGARTGPSNKSSFSSGGRKQGGGQRAGSNGGSRGRSQGGGRSFGGNR